MNFLNLHDPLLSVLFENDDIIGVNKPYGIDSHTNDSKLGNEDYIQPGLIELFERQLKRKLHIVHRLDRTTTGLIIFAKSLEVAKVYQNYFRNRETEKTYLFVTHHPSKRERLRSEKPILNKGANLEAQTDFKFLNRRGKFELWSALPHTGRNHQIRIHSQDVGIPILGDPKYGGAPYPFICLHNRKIAFPNGISIESEPPRYFRDLSLLENTETAIALFELDRRVRLYGDRVGSDQSLRLIHRRSQEESLDQWGGKSFGPVRLKNLAHDLGLAFGETGDQTVISREGRLQFELQASVTETAVRVSGIYPEQRLLRNWVLENSHARSVLNLFSYTCAFGVAAACGEAREVTSVDSNKNALEWGRRNFSLNGLDPIKSKFLCRDALLYLEQSRAKGFKFDLIICDPPAFSRGEKGTFKIETSLEPLLTSALQCLSDQGDFLFSTSTDRLFQADLRQAIEKVANRLGLKDLKVSSVQASLDCELPGEVMAMKAFLISRGRI